MLLHEKLFALQQALNVKNATLARESGLDAASVSRFLQGKRLFPYKYLPMLCQAMARLFPDGVPGAALPEELREITGDGHIEAGALSEAALAWLSDSPEYRKKRFGAKDRKSDKKAARRNSSSSMKVFGEKLSLLMDIAGVSGAQLSAALYIDPSLIYKYRIGSRSPKKETLDGISAYICSRITNADTRARMLASAGIANTGDMTAEEFHEKINAWLQEDQVLDVSVLGSLLETINDFSYFGGNAGVIPLEEIAPLAGDVSKNESFWGIEGMRQAATRYLYYAATLDAPVTMYICTTSTLDFLTMDLKWKAVWGSLMVHCLTKGHTIKMIHNMYDRNVSEIVEALESFGPLYMVGRMEPYIFKMQQSTTIRHTIYLIEDHAVVTASYAEGQDDVGEYVYSTEPQRLIAQKKHFEALLADCVSLADIYRSDDSMEGFDIRLGRFWGLPGGATLLEPSLSLFTMPESILRSILDRSKLDDETQRKIFDFYLAEKQWLSLQMDADGATELAVIADWEALTAGEVYLDIPSYLVTQRIPYTQDEYAAHLSHIRRFEKETPGYRFVELAESPFRNIKMYYKPDETLVEKAGHPAIVFAISNVYMCRAAHQMLSHLKRKR